MFAQFLNNTETLLVSIFNMSITASWLILAIFVLRLVFKKAPKWINCLLWAMAAIRLVIPFSFESVLSLVPLSRPVTSDSINNFIPSVSSNHSSSVINNTAPSAVIDSPNTGAFSVSALQIISLVWIVGIAVMLAYTLISYIKLRKNVGASVKLSENIYVCDSINSPFILGILRPKIYLPSSLREDKTDFIIAHERAHIKRLDYIWKPLGFLVLAVHWFNPLCWVAYVFLSRDIELACDEKVIKEYDIKAKKQYSETLLSCSVNRRIIAACPLAFGEVGVKERIKSVLNYKKPAFWIIIAAVIVCVITSVCLLTNPVNTMAELMGSNYTVEKVIYDPVVGKHAEEMPHPEFCITADKQNYYVKWHNSDEWTYEGDLEKIDFTKDQLMSLIGTDIIHKYNGGEIVEAYKAGEHLIFVGKSGDVFIGGATVNNDTVTSLSTFYKVKPTYKANVFDTDFYTRTIKPHIGRNVYTFALDLNGKNKNNAVVGFLAGDSKKTDEMTDMGFAVFKTSKKGCLMTDCTNYIFAKDENEIFLCPKVATLSDGKQYDVILNVSDKLARVEKSFGEKVQSRSVGAYEMLLFEVDEKEYDDEAEKAVYKCYDEYENELSFGGGLLDRVDPSEYDRTFGNITVTDVGSQRSDVSIKVEDIKINDGIILNLKWINNSTDTLNYGEVFDIQKKDGNKWVELESNAAWNLPAYPVSPKSENNSINTEKEYDLTGYYDLFSPGRYKFLTKYFFEKNHFEDYFVWVEFEITKPMSTGEYEVKTKSIPYEKNWQYGDLTKFTSNELKTDQTMKWKDSKKVYLFSAVTEDSMYAEKYLAAETDSKVLFINVGASYGDELYVCDVDGDGENEIVLHQSTSITGGAGGYLSRIYKIQGEELNGFFSTFEELGFDTGFTSNLENDFKIKVKNKFTKYEKNIDCSNRGYVGEFYNEKGKVVKDMGIGVDSCYQFVPEDVDGDGIYEISCAQYTWLYSHADGLGSAESVLKYNKYTKKFEVISAAFVPESIDSAISAALLSDNADRYYKGECPAEGHITLGTEEKGNLTYVYALTAFAYYGFQNENLVVVSEGLCPAVLEFTERDGIYEFIKATYAEAGEGFEASVKKIFPKKYHERILSSGEDDTKYLTEEMNACGYAYLDRIGRSAKVGSYSDFEYTYLHDLGVEPIIEKIISGKIPDYPNWIGTQEFIQNGERYVYEKAYNKDKNYVVCSKYAYGAGAADEIFFIDALTGEIIDRDSPRVN